MTRLVVKGAREHNLRNVDLDLPRDAMIVFTGLSGSGKSSLAFDTIFAEGQRRYVESLSAYARQFLGQVDKPDVDFIEGLSPAVSIDQKSTSKNPRSTVGTITEIYDYMRLLWARVGRPHCPVCGEPVTKQTPQQIVDQLLELPDGTRFQVLAPVVRGRKGEFVDLFKELTAKGYSRARVDGELVHLSDPPKLGKQFKHTIEVVVDRLVVKEGISQRLTDSVETALGLAEGRILAEFVDLEADDPERIRAFSEHLACPNEHPLAIDEIEPRSFSFNNPFGACSACSGIGTKLEVDEELLIPNPELSLSEGAIAPWSLGTATTEYWNRLLAGLAEELGFSMTTAWEKLDTDVRQTVLHGKDHKVVVQYRNRFGRERKYSTGFEGVVQYVHRKHGETDSDYARDRYEEYMRQVPCPACNGARLNPASLSVLINGKSIAEVAALPMRECAGFLENLVLTGREAQIAHQVLKEIQARLTFLLDVGLEYLNLERPSGTLSGGEAQRIRLATQIGSGLVGVLYVLDEPSIGLHQRDNRRLIETLTRLRDLGNTLIVVEHDEDTIHEADWVVDIGPGAGEHGGMVVHSGSYQELLENTDSLTGDYLSGRRKIEIPKKRRKYDKKRELKVVGAQGEQPPEHRRQFPAGPLHRRHRRQRLGQVHPGQRDPLQGPGQQAQRRQAGGRQAQVRPGPRTPGQGGPRRPEPHRPHPALQPGHVHRRVRQHPQALRRDHRGQGPRLPAGPVLLQRQGRPLRGLLRRRHPEDRDELPAGRLRPLRGLPRRPVQPRNPGGPLQGQDHRGRAEHAHRGRAPSSSRPSRRSHGTSTRSSTSALATSGWASPPPRSPAARPSA